MSSHAVMVFVSYPTLKSSTFPKQGLAAQLNFSSNHFFSQKAKAEQNWFFCKLMQLGKREKHADKNL